MEIKAIIFDAGGVIVSRCVHWTIDEISEKFNLPLEKVGKAIRSNLYDSGYMTSKIDEETYWKYTIKDLGVKTTAEELKKMIMDHLKPKKEVLKILIKLKRNYKLGLLTNHTNWLDEADKKYDFIKYFDTYVNSYHVGCVKPEKEIYEIILKKLGLSANECIFVDDKEENTEAAEKIGMKTIVFENTDQLLRELSSIGIK